MKKPVKYYTVQEAAKILGVTPKSVRNWIREGRLKAEKEFVSGKGWGHTCYKLSHSEVMKEKNTVPKCVWCEKVLKTAKRRLVSKFCCPEHAYLYRKSTGYFDQPQ